MKLEVGMYVRTRDGFLWKPKKIEIEEDNSVWFDDYYDFDVSDVKASHNIIDLIEVGDIITTNNLCGEITKIDIENNQIWIACCDYETCRSEDIKSIVTKELFEDMSYLLEKESDK